MVAVPVEEQSTVAALNGEDSGTTMGADNMQGGGPHIVALAWGEAGLRRVTAELPWCAAAEAGAPHGSGRRT
jgi:hypothetical protein